MDGFVKSSKGTDEPMGYYTPEVLPFAYSLAETYTLANRWFCSLPGPTYPNRRFLLAGTAFGGTATNTDAIIAGFENRHQAERSSTGSPIRSSAGATTSPTFPMSLVMPRRCSSDPSCLRFRTRCIEDCSRRNPARRRQLRRPGRRSSSKMRSVTRCSSRSRSRTCSAAGSQRDARRSPGDMY